MTIVKEYFEINVDNLQLIKKVRLRHDDKEPLTVQSLAELFDAAAKDYPHLPLRDVRIGNDGIGFDAEPAPGYTKLYRINAMR